MRRDTNYVLIIIHCIFLSGSFFKLLCMYNGINNNKGQIKQADTHNTKDSHYKALIKLRLIILEFNEGNVEYDVLINFLRYLIVIKTILKAIFTIKYFLL